jgi:hypothetical protein
MVGGVMTAQGYDQWLGNLREWQRRSDPHGQDLATFVAAWRERFGSRSVSAALLMALAEEKNVFLSEIHGTNEKGRLGSFSGRILARHRDTPVGGCVISNHRTSKERLWRLRSVEKGGNHDAE